MKRTGWSMACAAVGLLGATAYSDDIAWIKPAGAGEVVPAGGIAPAPLTAAKKAPGAAVKEIAWTGVKNMTVEASPIAVPAKGDDGVWRASVPAADGRIVQASYQIPVPEAPPVVPGKLPVAAPVPMVVPSTPSTPELSKVPSKPLPAPKVIAPLNATGPMSFTPTPALPATDSTSVWGGYNSALKPGGDVKSMPAVEATSGGPWMRNGTFGSPGLHLSRDVHVADGFTKPIIDDASPVESRMLAVEYLLWWTNSSRIPALASTSTVNSEDRTINNGIIGEANTRLLLGPGNFGETLRNGIRVRGRALFDDSCDRGFDGGIFALGRRTDSASFDSGTYPTIARPFFATNGNQEFVELVAKPGLATGSLTIQQRSSIWGADANIIHRCGDCCNERESSWFYGYRYLNLSEELVIRERILRTVSTQGMDHSTVPAGTLSTVSDEFETSNHFHGAQLGGRWLRTWDAWSIDARASVALGFVRQELAIRGSQTVQYPGAPVQPFTGGLLAVGTNIGEYERDRFGVLPEATLTLGYAIRPNWKLTIGYNVMTLNTVIRPGDQIDRVINVNNVPNTSLSPSAGAMVPASDAVRPLPMFRGTDLMIQGVQFGVQGRW